MKNTIPRGSVGVRSLGCSNATEVSNSARSLPFALIFMLLTIAIMVTLAPLAAQASSEVDRVTQGLTERVEFDVSKYQVIGSNPLSAATTTTILADFLGPNRGIGDIENAADALEAAMVAKGESFFQASFPPQELTDGVIDILITQYKIGKVLVKGNQHYSQKNIQSSLPVLRTGKSPNTNGIARALRVANQNAGKQVRISLSPGTGDNEIDANISVKDIKPLALSTWVNNTGTASSGDFRVGASVSHRNLFDLDHNASLSFVTSPEGFNDVQQIALSYRIPLYSIGGSVNFVAVNSNVDAGVVADVFDVAGRGEVYGVGYSHVFSSIGPYHHGLSVQAQDKLFDNDIKFLGRQLLEDVRSRPLSLTYQASWKNETGHTVSGTVASTSNLSGGSFNNARSYNLARIGASDDWSKLEFGASYQFKTKKEWLYMAALRVATSSDRLITGEQFSIGGSGSVGGLEERELRGDEGYLLNFQAWAPPIFKTLRAIAFIDAGHVSNNSPIAGELLSESVLSLGFTLNWNPTSHISAAASYGYLIDGIDSPLAADGGTEDGDGKLYFNATYRF
ncbi:MAG: ShlB/FhaC/HecB family hemolysin secretion/activation protein [Arenicella sp.]|nr:ShlB/FhaC/HecB family hemolysin secretion/activation protein [Arenicella sp.]